MVRLALVGGLASWHGRAFSGLINGLAEGQNHAANGPQHDPIVEGARIVTVWDDDPAAARSLAQTYGVDRVAETMEAASEGVDGIIIPDDASLQHQRRAEHFLKLGLPTFIDKPLSTDVAEAEAIYALAAQHKAPVMSCSALRFATETEEIRANPEAIGDIEVATTICGGELFYYGIHALELGQSVMGAGVRAVHNIGSPDRHIVKLSYGDGRTLIFMVYQSISYVFQLNLHGTKGRRDIVVTDGNGFYANTLNAVVEMVRTGHSSVPAEATIEIIRILAAAKQSLSEGREIKL